MNVQTTPAAIALALAGAIVIAYAAALMASNYWPTQPIDPLSLEGQLHAPVGLLAPALAALCYWAVFRREAPAWRTHAARGATAFLSA